jgi:hypothetical protein
MLPQSVEHLVVRWIDHLMHAGFMSPGEIRSELTNKLEALCDRDLVLDPSGGADGLQCLGIDQPRLFAILNIGRMRIVSKPALEKPRELAELLAGMKHANAPKALHGIIVDGIEGGLLGIREPFIDSPSEEIETDLVALARARGLAEEMRVVERPSEEEGVREYRLQLTDAITGQVHDLRTIVYCSRRCTSIYAVLPWNSPSLVAQLNRLFNRSWYFKTRGRFVSPADFRELVCIWGFYQTEHPEAAKFECIKPFFENPNSVVVAVRLDFKEVAPNKHVEMKAGIATYLEEQLRFSIGTLDARPDLRDLEADLWWDLGILRDYASDQTWR